MIIVYVLYMRGLAYMIIVYVLYMRGLGLHDNRVRTLHAWIQGLHDNRVRTLHARISAT